MWNSNGGSVKLLLMLGSRHELKTLQLFDRIALEFVVSVVEKNWVTFSPLVTTGNFYRLVIEKDV
jgi:hypothetical protein